MHAAPRLVFALFFFAACSGERSSNDALQAIGTADPTTGNAPLTVNFDGNQSLPLDGTITWDFGDGATSDATTPSHTYENSGKYSAVLTITAPDGASDSKTFEIDVMGSAASAPTAVANANVTSGAWPLAVHFDGRGSSDPDSDITSYRWSFGDETPDAEGAEVDHTFEAQGGFQVTLTVTDSGGRSATATIDVRTSAPPCPTFGSARVSGNVSSGILTEVSGMVASRSQDGILWVHNDSGDGPRVYALNRYGVLIAGYDLNVPAWDWEDIAIGPGPAQGTNYIYVGDIGDNEQRSNVALVHRFPEPTVPEPSAQPPLIRARNVETLSVSYPNNMAHNAEAMLVDPVSGDLYIITKGSSGPSLIFRAQAPLIANRELPLTAVGSLTFRGEVTAATISPDGGAIVVRTYETGYFWARPLSRRVEQVLGPAACVVRLANEMQGESITFSADGRDLFSLSEGMGQSIYYYQRN